MKLTWYGHACFKLESDEGSFIFDPYSPGSVPGLELPPLKADAVIMSHQHKDHKYAEGVELTGAAPSAAVSRFECFHDGQQGALRGPNLITVVSAEGIRAAHLGDLGHPLDDSAIKALGPIDMLMIPVGGFYTTDASEAKALTDKIRPRLIIPMHYRRGEQGLAPIAELQDFLSLFDSEEVIRLNSAEFDPSTVNGNAVIVFPWPCA